MTSEKNHEDRKTFFENLFTLYCVELETLIKLNDHLLSMNR